MRSTLCGLSKLTGGENYSIFNDINGFCDKEEDSPPIPFPHWGEREQGEGEIKGMARELPRRMVMD
jgi:hypothetical protein